MGYHAPNTLDEALEILAAEPATLFSGGTDVYPSLQGRDLPPNVIDIGGLDHLRGIEIDGEAIRIGALTRWSDIAAADLPVAFDGLRLAARHVGGRQIQNSGTIGGNICNASPAADGLPPLLTLDASVELASRHGRRDLKLSDFVTGPRMTCRKDDEIVTALMIPTPPPGSRGSFEKLGARAYLVISIAMVAALVKLDSEGQIETIRIAVGACSPVAKRLFDMENDLTGASLSDIAIDPAHLTPLSPIDDARATAAYRRAAVVQLCRRAILAAGGQNG